MLVSMSVDIYYEYKNKRGQFRDVTQFRDNFESNLMHICNIITIKKQFLLKVDLFKLA